MPPRIAHLASCLTLLFTFLSASQADGITQWLVPNGNEADFSSTFQDGNLITLSWKSLNDSICDLWVTAYDASNDYATRIASNIDVNTVSTYPWTISIGNEQISIDDKFVLRFIPTGTEYHAGQADQLASPGFLLVNRGQAYASSSAATAAATSAAASASSTSASASSSSTPSSQPSSDSSNSSGSSGVSPGLIVAAVVGAIVAVLIFLGLAIWALRLRRRAKAVNNKRSQGIWPENPLIPTMTSPRTEKKISGLFEANGDKQQAVELSARRRTEYFEMPA